jgi:hypothetical protein
MRWEQAFRQRQPQPAPSAFDAAFIAANGMAAHATVACIAASCGRRLAQAEVNDARL